MMAEKNALDEFDFNQVVKPGKFLKFEAGKSVTIRVLTKDPVVSETNFGDEPVARLNFVVWNFTAERAQILSASFNMGKTFQRIGQDEDFGANLQKCDIKISAEGEKLNRTYDINVLRHSGNEKELTQDQIRQCAALNLEEDIKEHKGRLSDWQPSKKADITAPQQEDEVYDVGDEEIDINTIPF